MSKSFPKIIYFTNILFSSRSGGWDFCNFNFFNLLSKETQLQYVYLKSFRHSNFIRIKSKVSKIFGLKRNYHSLSNSYLKSVSEFVNAKLISTYEDNSIVFFYGQMPWLTSKTKKKYIVWIDTTIYDYISVFNNIDEFKVSEIKRLCDLEEIFLRNAALVIHASNWCMKSAINQYNLTNKNIVINPPPNFYEHDFNFNLNEKFNKNQLNLIFVSKDFIGKGGDVAFEIFKLVNKQISNAKLTIIGDSPSENVLSNKNVEYIGHLNKDSTEDIKIFYDRYIKSHFLIHPTKKDTYGTVLIECSQFGCIPIAPKKFGIVDIIKDYENGFFLSDSNDLQYISNLIIDTFKDKEKLMEMSLNAISNVSENFSFESFKNKVITAFNNQGI